MGAKGGIWGRGKESGGRWPGRAEPIGIDGGRGSYKNAKKKGKKISKSKIESKKKSLRCEAHAA